MNPSERTLAIVLLYLREALKQCPGQSLTMRYDLFDVGDILRNSPFEFKYTAQPDGTTVRSVKLVKPQFKVSRDDLPPWQTLLPKRVLELE